MSTTVVERQSIEAQLASRSKQKQEQPSASMYQSDYEEFCKRYRQQNNIKPVEFARPLLTEYDFSNFPVHVPKKDKCTCAENCMISSQQKKRGKKASHPPDVKCRCCNSADTKKKNNKTKTPLWYRWQGLEWFCHRCFFRNVMRTVKGIQPQNYKIKQ